MTVYKFIFITFLVIGIALGAMAQDDQSPTPTPAPSADEQQGASPSDQATNPDTRPLTGAQPLTVGSAALENSYLLPSLTVQQTMNTNAQAAPGQNNLTGVGIVIGHLALQKLWKRAQLTASYAGGGVFNETNSDQLMFHQFGLSQAFLFRRWQLRVLDLAMYMPESSFGYWGLSGIYGGMGSGGMGTGGLGLGALGGYGGGSVINQPFLPNQSILTTQSSRWANTSLGEVTYAATPRLSFTAVGGGFFLRSSESQFVNTDGVEGSLGMNYELTAKDTLGLVYTTSRFNFPAGVNGDALTAQNLQLAYGRRVTGRLAFEVRGGPQLYYFHNAPTPIGRKLSWAMQSGLTYTLRRASLAAYYYHSVGAGSGVLPGASTNMVSAYLRRNLTRRLSGTVDVGYARNSSVGAPTSGAGGTSFNSEYAGVMLSRPWGHEANVFLSYNVQHQSSRDAACTTLWCGNSFLRHVVGIGLVWHKRPIPLG